MILNRPPEYGLEFLLAFNGRIHHLEEGYWIKFEIDHWHRTEDDPGRPYQFKDAETLIDDFFNEVERVLGKRGVGITVVAVEETRRSR